MMPDVAVLIVLLPIAAVVAIAFAVGAAVRRRGLSVMASVMIGIAIFIGVSAAGAALLLFMVAQACKDSHW